MKIGASTFIWVSPFSTEKDLALVDKVAEMGFDVLEIACEDPDSIDASALHAVLSARGLGAVVCGVFTPDRDLGSADATTRENAKEYVRWCIDTAYEIGSPIVVGPMYGPVGKSHPKTDAEAKAKRERSLDSLRELVPYADDGGVKLALEVLNRYETDVINTAKQGLEFITQVASPTLGLHLDTFHMHIEEKDSAAAIQLAGDRLFHLHVAENDRGVPGSGQVNWKDVFAALKAINYAGS